MTTAKEIVLELLNRTSDQSALSEIQYQLRVIEEINTSLEQIEKHGTVEHNIMEHRIRKWYTE